MDFFWQSDTFIRLSFHILEGCDSNSLYWLRLGLTKQIQPFSLLLFFAAAGARLLIHSELTLALHIVCFQLGHWVYGHGNWACLGIGYLPMKALRRYSSYFLSLVTGSSWLSCDGDLEPARKQAPNARSKYVFHMIATPLHSGSCTMPLFVLVGCPFFSLRPRHWKHSTWRSICRWLCFLHICFN